MFDNFIEYFQENIEVPFSEDKYNAFISYLGGRAFGNGLFNSFSFENISKWNEIVVNSYSDFKDKYKLFGYDWLGRCFAIDLRNETYGAVIMFEVGTADILEIPCSLEEFLENEIPLFSDACLAKTFFHEWIKNTGEKLSYGRCAGYKIPLFLGGEDTIHNLENSDMEVYWDIITQLKRA